MQIQSIAMGTLAMAGLSACMAGAAAPEGGLTCEVTRDGPLWSARAASDVPIVGTYEFTLTGSGAEIAQGGPLALAPGDRVLLGQAELPQGADIDARLTLMVAGQVYVCPVEAGR